MDSMLSKADEIEKYEDMLIDQKNIFKNKAELKFNALSNQLEALEQQIITLKKQKKDCVKKTKEMFDFNRNLHSSIKSKSLKFVTLPIEFIQQIEDSIKVLVGLEIPYSDQSSEEGVNEHQPKKHHSSKIKNLLNATYHIELIQSIILEIKQQAEKVEIKN